MNDQELADAIRARFAKTHPHTIALAERMGHLLANNPPWKPTPGGRAWWPAAETNVWTIGLDPITTELCWIVKRDNATLSYASDSDLEREHTALDHQSETNQGAKQ